VLEIQVLSAGPYRLQAEIVEEQARAA
jgi:hypothetical protein